MLPVAKKDFPSAYADKSRLQYYASLFSTVEINSSFYKLPMAGTIGRWANEVSEDFRFSFKISRDISHSRNLNFDPGDVRKFMTVLKHSASKKGCILIQFPGGLTSIHIAALKKLLEEISKYNTGNEWQLALEFRHSSWYTAETASLLKQFSAITVSHDMHPVVHPNGIAGFSGPQYYRFHGMLPKYRGQYTDEVLSACAAKIRSALSSGYPVYAYFNNSLGDAFGDATRLQQMLSCQP